MAAAEWGADLALGNRNIAEAEPVAAECRAMGRRVEAWPLDLASVESINRFVDQVYEAFGRIDVLVNNAGVNTPKPALDYSEAEFDFIADVNFKGAFFIATAVARKMIEQKTEGSIITISLKLVLWADHCAPLMLRRRVALVK